MIRTPQNSDRSPTGDDGSRAGPSKITQVRKNISDIEAKTRSPPALKLKFSAPVAEARALMLKAKAQLDMSGNIKSTIKQTVSECIKALYEIVRRMDKPEAKEEESRDEREVKQLGKSGDNSLRILNEILEVKEILIRSEKEELPARIERSKVELSDRIDAQMEEIKELKAVSKMQAEKVEARIGSIGTYAQVAAMPPQPSARKNMHSIIVSSSHVSDTSDTVVDKIRATVDAKSTGIRIDHLRRAKNQSVIISCSEKEEIGKVSAKLKNSRGDLKVEDAVNKNPLVVVRDVMNYITDDDLATAIRSQNGHLLEGAEISEGDIRVVYRRRARNPLTSHAVLRVRPVIWQRLTSAGRIHVDLQRVVVRDQSPLIQCTKCLGYGHSRKYCTEPAVLCSHCGEPHTRAECPGFTLNEKPKCRNCSLSKKDAAHNAFDSECPTRKKWDALARSAVAYC